MAATGDRCVSPHDTCIQSPEVSSTLNRQKSPWFAKMAVNMAVKVQRIHPVTNVRARYSRPIALSAI